MPEGNERSYLLYDPFNRDNKKNHKNWRYYSKLIASIIIILFIGDQIGRMSSHNNETDPLNFKIYNNNIRYDNRAVGTNERPWSERKFELYKSIRFNSFGTNTIITLQEVLKNQLDDILTLLNDEKNNGWSYAGVGRNDGKESGEYSPILYNSNQFKLLETSTFWLSETPDIPSRGWDADQERIVTWARLKSISTDKSINVFNTHLDHIGVKAREESVKLIANKTTTYNNDISFITGDFNSEPNEEAYQTLSKVFKDSRLYNANKYGYDTTFTDFIKTREKIIDYVFFDPRLNEVEGFGVLGNNYDGMFASDHRPVIVEISI